MSLISRFGNELEMTDTPKHTLYICYFGLREPLVQTQVIPYLLEIAKAGIRVSLLTFEPSLKHNWTAEQIESMRQTLRDAAIEWDCLAYHKRPSAIATAYDIFAGVRFIRRKIRDEQINILHGRVHVPTLMGALARRLSFHKPKLLFDIRGFFPEEYTDAGVWPENGLLYRTAKRVEKWLMRESDGFVVLTEKAREILFPESKETGFDKLERPVEVIPCCVDFEKRFSGDSDILREEKRRELNIRDRLVFTHVGALGGLYLTNEIADFLETARLGDRKTFALFLTQTDPNLIIPLLKSRGFDDADFFVGTAPPADMPGFLNAADVGLSFVKAGYATQSRSPTKIPEYLAAGLPIIANSGVGDVDRLIIEEGVGVLIDSFDRETYIKGLKQLAELGDIRDRCRETARRKFDLEDVGGVKYRQLYRRLLDKN